MGQNGSKITIDYTYYITKQAIDAYKKVGFTRSDNHIGCCVVKVVIPIDSIIQQHPIDPHVYQVSQLIVNTDDNQLMPNINEYWSIFKPSFKYPIDQLIMDDEYGMFVYLDESYAKDCDLRLNYFLNILYEIPVIEIVKHFEKANDVSLKQVQGFVKFIHANKRFFNNLFNLWNHDKQSIDCLNFNIPKHLSKYSKLII